MTLVLNSTLAWSGVKASVTPANNMPALLMSTSMRSARTSTSLTAWMTEASSVISSATTSIPWLRSAAAVFAVLRITH